MSVLFWTHLLAISEWMIRLIVLPIIVLRKERPATCLAWLAIVFFEPWIGLGAYLLVGENRLGRDRLKRRRRRRAVLETSEYPKLGSRRLDGAALEHESHPLMDLAEQVVGLPIVGGNQVAFYSNTDQVVDRLVEAIDRATSHVHLLFYIFRDDYVGRRVADALVRAQCRGAACRVLADAVASRLMFRSLGRELRAQGVEIHPVLPVNLIRRPFARLDLRNHRKLAVIDGSVAFTGSQNIVEASYGHSRGGVWHDVMARITGPVVHDLAGVFLEDWFHETGEVLDRPELFPPVAADGRVAMQVVPTGPDLPTEAFQAVLVEAIFRARRSVVITSPYFIPSEAMLLALRLAVLRGVAVSLIVPRRSDHLLVDAAGSFYWEQLLHSGVHVYLFPEGLLHAKTLTIDNEFAMFGSANYDIRSFDLNFELNVLLQGPEAVAELCMLQNEYMAMSNLAGFDDGPSRTWGGRLKANFAKLFSPLL
ncbi:MAG: cardiolipin synthase [Pirellulales bacterium]|nr:cardiolipin synthase [Pirellulales bacterium]